MSQYGLSERELEANQECQRNHGAGCWVVTAYHGNQSAFNGYHWTRSDWSEIRCTRCGRRWRTKAAYVERLPEATEDDWAKINAAIGVIT